MKHKAIETYYKGYRFRSRLEAKWAVFFDTIGIEWKYEEEGYQLPDGTWYLPDFKVKCWGKRGGIGSEPFDLYIEVKGEMTAEDLQKIWAFSGCSYIPPYDEGEEAFFKALDEMVPVLIVGDIPYIQSEDDLWDSNVFNCYGPDGFFNYETIDGDYYGAYPSVLDGKFFLMGDDCNYLAGDFDKLIKGYRAARSARFEHGEQGGVA